MSTLSQSDFDFWEFVHCGQCRLPFMSTSGATVPFWLTDCGHIVCNNHLNADQSCSQCGAHGIQLVPLQRQMDAPMSDWFRSIPTALDTVTFAAKFQQDTMVSHIRFYRSRHQRQRAYIEQLKKANEALNVEINQLRHKLGPERVNFSRPTPSDSQPADVLNPNGKRSLVEVQSYDHNRERPKTTSSPRSIITPPGPGRLTLPHSQQVPKLSSNRFGQENESSTQHALAAGFTERYTYNPPSTSHLPPQRFAHTQAIPQTFKRMRSEPGQQPRQAPSHTQGHQPTTSSSTLVKSQAPTTYTTQSIQPSQAHIPVSALSQGQQGDMGPPPTPQGIHRRHHDSSQAMQTITTVHSTNPPLGTNRFLPPVPHFASSPINHQAFQPGPPTPLIGNAPHRFTVSGSRAPSRGKPLDFPVRRQRMPFFSNAQHQG